MKKTFKGYLVLVLLITSAFSFFAFNLQDEPWDESQLMQPEELAKVLKDPKARKPVVLNVGPMDKIKTAKDMGIGSTQEGIEKFKSYVDKLPLQQEIVIYCGCCKLHHCPNIKKTFLYLEARGYTNHKLLNLQTSLDEDWVKKGFPMEVAAASK